MDTIDSINAGFEVRAIGDEDREWIRMVLRQYWATTTQVSKGRVFEADTLPGLGAWRGGERVGLLTYNIDENGMEVVTHNALAGHGGIGSCLLSEGRKLAREKGMHRIWLTTTNDNTPAIRFYQRRGFDLVALHRNAVLESRSLKPEIPDLGMDGIPIRHELEMEIML